MSLEDCPWGFAVMKPTVLLTSDTIWHLASPKGSQSQDEACEHICVSTAVCLSVGMVFFSFSLPSFLPVPFPASPVFPCSLLSYPLPGFSPILFFI